MRVRRAIGLAFGYGLLAVALAAAANALRVLTLTVLGSAAVTDVVFYAMVNIGAALVLGTGGYVLLQRVRRIGAGRGVTLAWGRVLGP